MEQLRAVSAVVVLSSTELEQSNLAFWSFSMSSIFKKIVFSFLWLSSSAWAGIDSGGTITVCGQPLEEWSVPMSNVLGYEGYNAVLEKLKKDIPTLAVRLSEIQKTSWFYPSCDPGTIKDDSLDIPASKAIAFYDDFIVAFQFNLQKMKDPSLALVHEAVRNLCRVGFKDSQSVVNETNCTLRNTDLIYNKYRKEGLSAQELLSNLVFIEDRCNRFGENCVKLDMNFAQLQGLIKYMRGQLISKLSILGRILRANCTSDSDSITMKKPPIVEEIDSSVPLNVYGGWLLQSDSQTLYKTFGIEGWWDSSHIEVNCRKVANIPALVDKIRADFNVLDEQELAKRIILKRKIIPVQ